LVPVLLVFTALQAVQPLLATTIKTCFAARHENYDRAHAIPL